LDRFLNESSRTFFHAWFDFVRREEEAVARLAHHPKLPPQIVIHNDRELNLILQILLNGLHHSNLSGKRKL
jgi:hypothetical protein